MIDAIGVGINILIAGLNGVIEVKSYTGSKTVIKESRCKTPERMI